MTGSDRLEEPGERRGLDDVRGSIQQQRRRLHEHFHAAPDAYLVTNADGVIENASRAAVELLVTPRDSLIGRRVVEFLRERDARGLQSMLQAVEDEGSARRQMEVHPRVGGPVVVEAIVSDAGAESAYRWLIRDVSERVAAERERARVNRLRDDFLLLVTHNLRTPIASILRTIELMHSTRGPRDGEGLTRALNIIEDSARELDRLSADVVDLERVAADQLALVPVPVDVGLVARTVAAQLESVDQPIAVSCETGTVVLDPSVVERILTDLVENAVKHTPDGTPIGIDIRPEERGVVRLDVWDAGPGVDDDDKAEIFELFRRGTTRAEGTGVGLYLVARFAEHHGGLAWVEDNPGGGARFCVTLAAPPSPHPERG